jgi:DNA repair protein RecO (recombination protein O)
MPRVTAKEVKTEGIILRVRTWGEDDLLVDFLTPHEGRLAGIARHGRKSRKRFGTVLESLNIVSFRYRDRGVFVSLEEAVLERPLVHLAEDLKRLIGAFCLVDLVRESIPEKNPDPRLYFLLKDSLVSLNDSVPVEKTLREFESRLLDLLGYRPHLQSCLGCGREAEKGRNFCFVFRDGGLYCADCLPGGTSFAPYSEAALHPLLLRFLEYQIGRPLKSHKFLTGSAFSD